MRRCWMSREGTPTWLIGEGMTRHSIMASSSVGRGEPVLASRGLKSHACNVVWGVRLAKGGLKRRQKLQFRLLFSLKLALLCKIVAGALHLPV